MELAAQAVRVWSQSGKTIEIGSLEASADSLAEKTAEWGFDRVDRATTTAITSPTDSVGTDEPAGSRDADLAEVARADPDRRR